MRRGALVLSLLLVGCGRAAELTQLPPAPGTLRVLDVGGPEGDVGAWPSVTIDGTGVPHVAYCDVGRGDLRYATRQDERWLTETAVEAGAVGKYASLAVTSANAPAVAYYDQDRAMLRYATRAGGAWESEDVAWGLEAGVGGRLTFDASGAPDIFYYLPTGEFRRSQRTGSGAWRHTTLARATFGPHTSTGLLGSVGDLWVSFVDWDFERVAPVLAHVQGQVTALERLPFADARAGFTTGLYRDDGVLHVLYTSGQDLTSAWRDGVGWRSVVLAHDVGTFAVASNAHQDVALTLQDRRGGRVVLLRKTPSGFAPQVVDSEGPLGDHLALALDVNGRVVLAYHAAAIHGIKLYEE